VEETKQSVKEVVEYTIELPVRAFKEVKQKLGILDQPVPLPPKELPPPVEEGEKDAGF